MAISSGDWSASTDPYILAIDHAYTSIVDTLLTNNMLKIVGSEGYLGGYVQNKDVQELYFINDDAIQEVLNADSAGFRAANLDSFKEFGTLHTFSGSISPTYPQPIIMPDTKDFYIYLAGISGGIPKDTWSLFAYSAYAWENKDPAQLIFAWISHYVKSLFTLKDYLDQSSFQDASDYYDENPCLLSCWREVGLSIAGQIKKVMDHTSDFLVVGPQDTTGDVLMSLKTKRSGLTTRGTAIDLESESIRHYTIRPTDRYTIDKLSIMYGNVYVPPHWFGYPSSTLVMPPVEYFHDERTRAIQKTGSLTSDRILDLDLAYHYSRSNVLSHLDLGFWKDDQDELEIEFADMTHLNFEAGDIVPVTGRGYDGTELFLVTEKIPNWDTMLATCRLIMILGVDGKSPKYADVDNMLLHLSPNTLGMFFDGSASFPLDTPNPETVRNFNRLLDQAANAHATEHTRGIVGPGPPVLWPLNADKKNGWPGFSLATNTGLEISYDANDGRDGLSKTASNYTFYWVGNPTIDYGVRCLFRADGTFPDNLAFNHVGGGTPGSSGTPGKVQYFDGVWRGTSPATTGWQILVFSLDFFGLSKIRRNGVDLETGLPYTPRTLSTSHDIGLGVYADGTTGVFQGDWMECALFVGAHNDATIQLIEAHLAEKYNITI